MAVAVTNTDSPVSTSSATTFDFTSAALGTAVADRVIAVGASGFPASRTLSSGSVAGVSAAVLLSVVSGDSAAGGFALMSAAVPTGTTGTVSVTWSGACTWGCGIGVYRITGADGATPASTASDNTATSNAYSASLTIPTDGGAVGYVGFAPNVAPKTITWTNLTENFDEVVNALGAYHSGALSTTAGAATRTATASGSLIGGAMVLAAWAAAAAAGSGLLVDGGKLLNGGSLTGGGRLVRSAPVAMPERRLAA